MKKLLPGPTATPPAPLPRLFPPRGVVLARCLLLFLQRQSPISKPKISTTENNEPTTAGVVLVDFCRELWVLGGVLSPGHSVIGAFVVYAVDT